MLPAELHGCLYARNTAKLANLPPDTPVRLRCPTDSGGVQWGSAQPDGRATNRAEKPQRPAGEPGAEVHETV
jgi:hypothetical protein